MSYILDALRKADAERERDPARGIHAQTAALPADAAPRFPSWLGGAVAVVAVLAAGAAWLLRPVSAPAPAVAAAAPAPVAVPAAPVAREAPPKVIPVAASVSPPAPPPLPAPERVAAKPAPVEVARAAPATVVATATKPVAPATALVLKAAPAVAAAAAAAAAPRAAPGPAAPLPAAAPTAERILTVAELPLDVQQSLPKLQISGGVYSDNATQRMLIVGGQVMNEGAELAPGAVLEQIKPHAAVLKFRGYRYSVAY